MEDGLHVQREEVHLSTVTLILYVQGEGGRSTL